MRAAPAVFMLIRRMADTSFYITFIMHKLPCCRLQLIIISIPPSVKGFFAFRVFLCYNNPKTAAAAAGRTLCAYALLRVVLGTLQHAKPQYVRFCWGRFAASCYNNPKTAAAAAGHTLCAYAAARLCARVDSARAGESMNGLGAFFDASCRKGGHFHACPQNRMSEHPPGGNTVQNIGGPAECRAPDRAGFLGRHRHGRGQAAARGAPLGHGHQAGRRGRGPMRADVHLRQAVYRIQPHRGAGAAHGGGHRGQNAPPQRGNDLQRLLQLGAIPVINENDTVSTAEIAEVSTLGDNDTLASIVAVSVEADLLVLLSDIEGLYTADPHKDPDAVLIREVAAITPDIEALAGARAPARARAAW